MSTIVIVASLTLLASFLCSLFEAALYAITPAKVALLERSGGAGAKRLARMRSDIEEPIAAILTVNTIAHTLGAAWCGAMVGEKFGSGAVSVFAAIFTVLVLTVTEIVPKSLGVRYADRLGALIAWPLQVMIWSVWPIVWTAKRAMGLLTGGDEKSGPSEDEVMVTARLAAEHGSVRAEEHRWIRNALRLDQVTAGQVRTPRPVVDVRDVDTPLAELRDELDGWVHSRVPVAEDGQSDHILGLIYRREICDELLRDPDTKLRLRDLMKPIRFVPESMPAHALLELFVEERSHLVAVTDEYGGFEGVVTLEDVFEAILGHEIVDEHDQVADMQSYARAKAGLLGAPDRPSKTDDR
ncbi:MAG: hemolysin family protein [Planctomycetota bacterium]